ncbi:MOSC N-terminal beta barrel domain-containing protein [Mycotypha africana]|uniref:MOSC N-terminal beta barrel domain-containing protein n=1 Tax=Mycotypha africana TaxID=64632 RepID=UPI002300BBDA|nr:MOSC N-terminal beta barrel domain-containing protein [Mycotypha africana]KAI8971441.1 MOSC N-terminal beta barrel domain-containing protein [Mycotypha africana]
MSTADTPTVESILIYPIKSCHYIQLQECEVDNLGLKYDRRFMIVYEDTNHFVTQRKFASLTLLKPLIDEQQNTLTLTADGQKSFTLPLKPEIKDLDKRVVKLWKDKLTVYDMGDEAAVWITQFISNHRQHDLENSHNPDDPVNVDEPVRPVRLVTLDDPKNGVYYRPAHPKLNGPQSAFADWSPISFGFSSSLKDVNRGLKETGISKGHTIPMNRFRNNITISGTVAWEEDQWLVAKVGEVTVYIVRPIARCTVPGIDQDTGVKDTWDGKGPTDYLKLRRQFVDEPNQGQFCCDVIPLTSGKIRVGDKVKVLERIPEEYKQESLPPLA